MSNSAVNKKQPPVQVTVKDLRHLKILCEAPEHSFFSTTVENKIPRTERKSYRAVILE